MSLDKYLSDSRRLDAERVKHCVSLGSQGEDLFKELTNAMKTDVEEDKQHIDFYWDGRRVDVKGPKPMHKEGYVLLEFMNVWGNHGWCAKESKADYIAFQFPDAFYVFEKTAIRRRAIGLCEPYSEDSVIRKNRIKPYDGLGKWLGRWNSKDVFTYLRLTDIKDLIYDKIPLDV